MDTRLLPPSDAGLATAGEILRAGGLVAFPTETVYGLGANALDPDAVRRVFEVKGRPTDNPLIVHLPDGSQLDRLVTEVTPLAHQLAERFWPGPLTLVLPVRPEVPRITTGGLSTVAIRVPDHPIALAVLEEAAVPVAAPSANRSGRPSPTTPAHVLSDLQGRIEAVIEGGRCLIGLESTVVDARGTEPVVLREGAISREDLGLEVSGINGDLARSPGTRHRHYRPACRVEIAPAGGAAQRASEAARAGDRVGLVSSEEAPRGVNELGRFQTAGELASMLYETLRVAESAGLDLVVVEAVPETGVGRAVMDRLRRASA